MKSSLNGAAPRVVLAGLLSAAGLMSAAGFAPDALAQGSGDKGKANVTAASMSPQAGRQALLLVPEPDERLSRSRLERGSLNHATGPAAEAVAMALKEAADELREAGTALALRTVGVADAAAAAKAAKDAGASTLLLLADLPATWLQAAAAASPLPVLNLSAGDDRLRGADCRANLWHVAPSERMRADALAQTLVARKWMNVLLLTGPTEADRERSATAQAALKRYGLKLAANKPFKLSADPRERDLANPLLLTQGSYDVVWVVDTAGDFAPALPYRTALPRPVVGDGGLAALAWSSKFDRYGAPQVTRRLVKAAGRRMEAQDWQAWMGGKAAVAVALATARTPAASLPAAVNTALRSAELDGSKGVVMGFRPWDGQLRQPLLLSDGQAVIGSAPLEGVMHPSNALDTLGADAPEKLCKARP